MSDIEGIASSARGLRQLKILVALMELIDETPGLVEVWRDEILDRAGESGIHYRVWAEDAQAMDRNGWVRFEESIAGIDSPRLTRYRHTGHSVRPGIPGFGGDRRSARALHGQV